MKINLYLTFDEGKCSKAFDFYKNVFGSEITSKMTYKEAPFEVPDAQKDHIMHMSLPLGSNMDLMGSDKSPMFDKEPYQIGNHAQIAISPTDRSKADDLFSKLSADGGKVDMPLKDMFWGSYFGSCTDQFGIKWMIDCAKADAMQEVKKTVQTMKQQLNALEEILAEENGNEEPVTKKAKN